MPERPNRDAVERVRSCALLLYLSRQANTERANRLLTEADLMRAARRPGPTFPAVLRPSLNGWLIYQVRDCLAVVHEAALGEVVSFLNAEGRSPGGLLASEVVGQLLSDGPAFRRLWTDLGLPGTLGDLRDIRIADLARDDRGGMLRTTTRNSEAFGGGMVGLMNGSSSRHGGATVGVFCCSCPSPGCCQTDGQDRAYERRRLYSTGFRSGVAVAWV